VDDAKVFALRSTVLLSFIDGVAFEMAQSSETRRGLPGYREGVGADLDNTRIRGASNQAKTQNQRSGLRGGHDGLLCTRV
jgi:hypothetical protein